jgi:hypothetical protein
MQELQAQIAACQKDKLDMNTHDAVHNLNDVVEAVRKAHGWGNDVRFNYMTGQMEQTIPPEKAPDGKPDKGRH